MDMKKWIFNTNRQTVFGQKMNSDEKEKQKLYTYNERGYPYGIKYGTQRKAVSIWDSQVWFYLCLII